MNDMKLVPHPAEYQRLNGSRDSSGLTHGGPPIDMTRRIGTSPQNIDLVGPLLRRKYVVILFAILGAGLGYMAYKQASPVYESNARLMIFQNSLPRQFGDDTLFQQTSIAKYENLIGSEAVLGHAIENSELDKTETLAGPAAPLQSLRSMFTIVSNDEDDDTINLSLTGPNAEELPIILSGICDAFELQLAENTRAAGNKALELIESLKRRLDDQNQEANDRYRELLKKLRTAPRAVTGELLNPHVERLQQLQTELLKHEMELQDIVSRMVVLARAKQANDQEALRVYAHEGRVYLGIEYSDIPWSSSRRTRKDDMNFELDQQITAQLTMLQNRISECDVKIIELEAQRLRLGMRLGRGHETMISLQQTIESWNAQRQQLLEQIGQVRTAWLATDEDKREDEFEKRLSELEDIRQRDEAKWLEMYATALPEKKERLEAQIQETSEKLKELELSSEEVSRNIEDINILRHEISERSEVRQAISNALTNFNILNDNYHDVRCEVIDKPMVGRQIGPNFIKYLGIGIFLASVLGFGLALLIDYADHSFRNPGEISAIFNAPVVGRIPRIRPTRRLENKLAGTLACAHKPGSSTAEAIRAIRTAMFFNAAENGSQVFLFTSPSPGDGKSTTIGNLAISMAQAGKRVCLVDCDFRRPRVHRYFATSIEPGLMGVINGEVTIEEAIQPSFHENLSLLTCGGNPENPGEFVLQPQLREVFSVLKEEFDFVLVDSPPVVPVSDPVILASFVDAVYVVLRIRKGVAVAAKRAMETLSQVNANIHGVMVNGVDQNPYYDEFGYGYGYQLLSGQGRYGYGRHLGGYYDSDQNRPETSPHPYANGSHPDSGTPRMAELQDTHGRNVGVRNPNRIRYIRDATTGQRPGKNG